METSASSSGGRVIQLRTRKINFRQNLLPRGNLATITSPMSHQHFTKALDIVVMSPRSALQVAEARLHNADRQRTRKMTRSTHASCQAYLGVVPVDGRYIPRHSAGSTNMHSRSTHSHTPDTPGCSPAKHSSQQQSHSSPLSPASRFHASTQTHTAAPRCTDR
eukprot:5918502-Amphidinium_carterae.1